MTHPHFAYTEAVPPPPPGKYGMLRPPFEIQNICLKCRVDRKIRTKHPPSSSTTFGPTFIRGRRVFKALGKSAFFFPYNPLLGFISIFSSDFQDIFILFGG